MGAVGCLPGSGEGTNVGLFSVKPVVADRPGRDRKAEGELGCLEGGCL
jgi:hypothetical protein